MHQAPCHAQLSCHKLSGYARARAGNLFRTADGRLAYIDFGMMGEIEPNVRRCPRAPMCTDAGSW